ncbi:protocatechuate 3,4-dioxygenase subunit beta [Klebsiella pneumoniae subsp. pneumoniae]|nr:protocatechuate 3,4-dioxygenase subunit beta [Klebsiella pneumoniae subsp. pneumoniae]
MSIAITVANPPAYAPGYKTSVLRSPKNALISLQNSLSEITGPVFSRDDLGPLDNDLILNYAKKACRSASGSSSTVTCAMDSGRPMKNTLVEVWQANAGGRYRHKKISIWRRLTRTLAAAAGCLPMKTAITVSHHQTRPLPWRNQASDWRPAHIHFSLSGDAWAQRLITQMYF